MKWYYKISLKFYRWIRQLDKNLVTFVSRKLDEMANNVTVTSSYDFDNLSRRIDKKLEEDKTFPDWDSINKDMYNPSVSTAEIEVEVTGAEKIGLNRKYGIAIADVLIHPTYGIGSNQPDFEANSVPNVFRILFKDGMHRYISGDELDTVSRKESIDYWLWFNDKYLEK